jgi:hypothetical protein
MYYYGNKHAYKVCEKKYCDRMDENNVSTEGGKHIQFNGFNIF